MSDIEEYYSGPDFVESSEFEAFISETLDRLDIIEAKLAITNEPEREASVAGIKQQVEKFSGLTTAARTQAATEARQGKILDSWRAAFKIMIPVILQCYADGPKKRTKNELQVLCSKNGGKISDAQLEFLRECLGPDHINTDGGPPTQE